MSTILIKPSTLASGLFSLLSVGSLALGTPSHAFTVDLTNSQTFGDVITQPNQAFMTNAFSDSFDDPVNFNVSGNDPVFAFDLESALGLADGSLGLTSGDGSAIKRNFTAQAGDILSFEWNFLTNHETSESNRNDYAFISINDSVIPLADTNSSLTSPGLNGLAKQTGLQLFSYTFTAPIDYTVGIGVLDVGDDITTSALSVSNVNYQPVPEPSALLGLVAAGAGIFFKSKPFKKQK